MEQSRPLEYDGGGIVFWTWKYWNPQPLRISVRLSFQIKSV